MAKRVGQIESYLRRTWAANRRRATESRMQPVLGGRHQSSAQNAVLLENEGIAVDSWAPETAFSGVRLAQAERVEKTWTWPGPGIGTCWMAPQSLQLQDFHGLIYPPCRCGSCGL